MASSPEAAVTSDIEPVEVRLRGASVRRDRARTKAAEGTSGAEGAGRPWSSALLGSKGAGSAKGMDSGKSWSRSG